MTMNKVMAAGRAWMWILWHQGSGFVGNGLPVWGQRLLGSGDLAWIFQESPGDIRLQCSRALMQATKPETLSWEGLFTQWQASSFITQSLITLSLPTCFSYLPVVYHYTPVASGSHLVGAPNLNVINLLQHSEFKPLNSGFFLLRL